MSVRSQAQATSTMSGVVTLTLTNAFLKQQQFTYTSNNRQEYFSIQSKPKKTQNKLQNTEKRQNPKRLKQQFRTTKTLKIKQKNLTSYCIFFFQFQIARYFWDHNLSKPNSLYRSLDLKLKIPKKNTTKMFDTITSMPFMYDECLCKCENRQLGWWPPATDRAISSIFGTRRTKWRAKIERANRN